MNNQDDKPKAIAFVCEACGKSVSVLKVGVRNHCPHCLCSLHTDIFPGDNANECHGLMVAVSTLYDEDENMLLLHKCTSCGKTARARVEMDDNYDEILKILSDKK